MSSIPQEIFRAYDIRGIVPEQLNEFTVDQIGRAIAAEMAAHQQTRLVVARDGRLSGPKFKSIFIRALLESGCDVVDVGAVPTPLLHFAIHSTGCQNGVMLTGSHNPAQYNGFKIVIAGEVLSSDAILQLYHRCCQQQFVTGLGTVTTLDIVPTYQRAFTENITLVKPLKIVVDAGNGIAGQVAPACYRALGCEVVELFCAVDGHFPNHHPDPCEPSNLHDLRQAVRLHQADIGLAFDGDGDRLGVVTHTGEMIFPDRQMILFAEAVLKNHPGSKIIYDVKCTINLRRAIVAAGGVPCLTKTGHSFVRAALFQHQAPLAGEMSGHIFFADRWYGFDDGLYAGARLLEILSRQNADTLWSRLPNTYHTPELKVVIDEQEKFTYVERFISEARFPGATTNTLDGLRVEFDTGWGLIRASNTTPSIVLRFEANSPQALTKIQDDFRREMQRIAPNIPVTF